MQRRHELLPSNAMGRHVHLWQFGHFGQPVVVFPSAAGMAHEWDAHGMVDALAPLIDGGKLKLYCTETNVSEAWTARHADPGWRLERHRAFERYVTDELVPYVRRDCHSESLRVGVAGCSLGAFYACNFALKNPELFAWALCMSGRYDMASFLGGYSGLDSYYNNPLAYVANLAGDELERVRAGAHLVLVCGQGRWEEGNIEETRRIAELLEEKGISHQLDLWGHDVDHEWAWWRRQVRHHLGNALGG